MDEDWDSRRPPYDEVLDVYMKSRGWWSYRRDLEDRPHQDFIFDAWQWGGTFDYVLVQCIGSGKYEIVFPSRGALWYAQSASEILTSRDAVIRRVPDLEQLMINTGATYDGS